MFEWCAHYADARGRHKLTVLAKNQDQALDLLALPHNSILRLQQRWVWQWPSVLRWSSALPTKLQLLLLTQISALLASGEAVKFNQLLQASPALKNMANKHPEVWRDDFSLSEKLQTLQCNHELVATIAMGEKTGTLAQALQTAIHHTKQSLTLKQSTQAPLYFGALLFVVSIISFFTLPTLLREPLETLTQTEGIHIQLTWATHLLLLINQLTSQVGWLSGGVLGGALLVWLLRKFLLRLPPLHHIERWRCLRRSLNFLYIWRPLRLAQVPSTDYAPAFQRALGASLAQEVMERLQAGESLATILQASYFSPMLGLASRGLVEADESTFIQTIDILLPSLLQEQHDLSKRVAIFFYLTGIMSTISVVLMISFGLIFPILGATASLQ